MKIDSPGDPRVAPYVNLPERRSSARAGRFIAEGELVVRRLLASELEVESLLVADSQIDRIEPLEHIPLYHASQQVLESIAGFRFHRGILGCARRPEPSDWAAAIPGQGDSALVVVCSAVRDPENLGGILRNCAAFGVDLVLIGDSSADPFARRVLRVSMATALSLPLGLSRDVVGDLERLERQFGFHTAATVLDDKSRALAAATRPPRLALVLGNELQGVDASLCGRCQWQVTIPMSGQTDSLNVAVASGIFLHHFTQVAPVIPVQ